MRWHEGCESLIEWKGCGLIELFFQHFTEATEENLKIAGIRAGI
jgi:hypothetical protein